MAGVALPDRDEIGPPDRGSKLGSREWLVWRRQCGHGRRLLEQDAQTVVVLVAAAGVVMLLDPRLLERLVRVEERNAKRDPARQGNEHQRGGPTDRLEPANRL